MILTDKVKVRINNINIKYYNSLNFNVKLNDVLEVDVNKLSNGSKYRIDVKCDKCGIIKNHLI